MLGSARLKSEAHKIESSSPERVLACSADKLECVECRSRLVMQMDSRLLLLMSYLTPNCSRLSVSYFTHASIAPELGRTQFLDFLQGSHS